MSENIATLKSRSGVNQDHWNCHRSIECINAYDFLSTFHSNHGPVSYRFRDRRRFQSKIAKFSHPTVFCAPAEGVPLELGIGAGSQKTRMMGLPGRKRSLSISSAVWIECTNVTDRQTDGRTDGDSNDRAYAVKRILQWVSEWVWFNGAVGIIFWVVSEMSCTDKHRATERRNTKKTQSNIHNQRGPRENTKHTQKKTNQDWSTKSDLVVHYDIRPGSGSATLMHGSSVGRIPQSHNSHSVSNNRDLRSTHRVLWANKDKNGWSIWKTGTHDRSMLSAVRHDKRWGGRRTVRCWCCWRW